MPRGTRSQPTQSQPAPTQTQRRRRRNADDEDDGDAYVRNGDMDVDGDNDDLQRKANDLVRLALFSEQRRVPLKREEINKKVMGSGTRAFNNVFVLAQQILQNTFGMDLVELHRDAEDQEPEPSQTTGVKKRAAATGTKSYILRSTLHPTIIEIASQSDPLILAEESVDAPDAEDDEDGWPRAYGSIIAWSGSDQLGSLGILHVVLSLILVSGRVMNDGDLRSHLKRLRLDYGANVPVGAQATHRTLTIESFLSQAQRAGYLDQSRIGTEGAAKRGGKRGRNAATDDDNVQYEWRWGPRAHAEIGEAGIGRFLAEFMAERSAEDDDQDDEDMDAGERQEAMTKKIEKRFRGIETAAGGTLNEVR